MWPWSDIYVRSMYWNIIILLYTVLYVWQMILPIFHVAVNVVVPSVAIHHLAMKQIGWWNNSRSDLPLLLSFNGRPQIIIRVEMLSGRYYPPTTFLAAFTSCSSESSSLTGTTSVQSHDHMITHPHPFTEHTNKHHDYTWSLFTMDNVGHEMSNEKCSDKHVRTSYICSDISRNLWQTINFVGHMSDQSGICADMIILGYLTVIIIMICMTVWFVSHGRRHQLIQVTFIIFIMILWLEVQHELWN